MNKSVYIFLGLVSLASTHVLPTEPIDKCKDISPEVYCASSTQTQECHKTEFCKEYLSRWICDRGPEAYCATKEAAQMCNKEAYCLTWPDDSVVAVKITPSRPVYDNDDNNNFGHAAAGSFGGIG